MYNHADDYSYAECSTLILHTKYLNSDSLQEEKVDLMVK